MTISFNKFIYGMTLYELYSTEESTGKVPCIFRVGPRRFLEALADPSHTKARYMYHDGKKRVFVSEIPVEFTTKYGKPFFDAPAFLEEKDIPHTFCDKLHYKWNRKMCSAFSPNSFLREKYGVCFHFVNWLDIEIDHSDIYFMDGALTLCGKKVDSISWKSFCNEDSAVNPNLRAKIQELLQKPHQFGGQELRKAVKQCAQMQCNEVFLQTDFASFRAERGTCCELSIYCKKERLRYALPKDITTQTMLEVLISLLEAKNEQNLWDILNQHLCSGMILLPR